MFRAFERARLIDAKIKQISSKKWFKKFTNILKRQQTYPCISAYIDSEYITKDLISIHAVWKKAYWLLQCAKSHETLPAYGLSRAFLGPF